MEADYHDNARVMSAQAQRANFTGVSLGNTESAPLTVSALQKTESALEIAHEAAARLYGLKERLFGLTPENGEMAAKAPEPHAFADVLDSKQRALIAILHRVDALSTEIANRL